MFPAAVLVGIQSLGMGLGHHEFKAHETGMQPRNLNLCCCWANILHYNTLHIDYDLRGKHKRIICIFQLNIQAGASFFACSYFQFFCFLGTFNTDSGSGVELAQSSMQKPDCL